MSASDERLRALASDPRVLAIVATPVSRTATRLRLAAALLVAAIGFAIPTMLILSGRRLAPAGIALIAVVGFPLAMTGCIGSARALRTMRAPVQTRPARVLSCTPFRISGRVPRTEFRVVLQTEGNTRHWVVDRRGLTVDAPGDLGVARWAGEELLAFTPLEP